jgi:hypothetical protein
LSEFLSEGGSYKTCSAGDEHFHGWLLTVS